MDQFVEKGLGGFPRKPLPKADAACEAMIKKDMQAAVAFENSLP